MLVGADNRAIEQVDFPVDLVLLIRFALDLCPYSFPDASFSPTIEAARNR